MPHLKFSDTTNSYHRGTKSETGSSSALPPTLVCSVRLVEGKTVAPSAHPLEIEVVRYSAEFASVPLMGQIPRSLLKNNYPSSFLASHSLPSLYLLPTLSSLCLPFLN